MKKLALSLIALATVSSAVLLNAEAMVKAPRFAASSNKVQAALAAHKERCTTTKALAAAQTAETKTAQTGSTDGIRRALERSKARHKTSKGAPVPDSVREKMADMRQRFEERQAARQDQAPTEEPTTEKAA